MDKENMERALLKIPRALVEELKSEAAWQDIPVNALINKILWNWVNTSNAMHQD